MKPDFMDAKAFRAMLTDSKQAGKVNNAARRTMGHGDDHPPKVWRQVDVEVDVTDYEDVATFAYDCRTVGALIQRLMKLQEQAKRGDKALTMSGRLAVGWRSQDDPALKRMEAE